MKKLLLVLTSLCILPYANSQTARIQAIHNSADAAASEVDIYLTTPLGSSLLIDDFAFRTASPFIDAPAGVDITVGVAPSSSASVNDTIPGASFTYNLTANNTYILVAEGIVSASGYSPLTPFGISVYGMGREVASMAGNTDVLVHHGSTDAPTVDVDEVTAGNLVDDASYGDFAGYLELATADYQLQVKDASGTNVVASYDAPLETLNLEDSALVVVASGFLDPSNNSNGSAFGLFVALPSGGALIPLPVSTATSISEINQLKLSLYPNPVTEFIIIDGLELTNTNITILDINGKLIESTNYSVRDNSIDVSQLIDGAYVVTISNSLGLVSNARFIKQ